VGRDEREPLSRQKIELLASRRQELAFSSDFESGNLDLAIRIKKNEYDCFMRSDTNTKGHTNWYFFRVNNRKQTGIVQLNLCNIVKQHNLYGQGMTPYTCENIHGEEHE
jgi:hypothetical protein